MMAGQMKIKGGNMLNSIKQMLSKKKKGAISIISVLLSLGAVVILIGIITTYEHQLIVRNLEAVADLAAVESLRKVIDENSLRNEKLEIKPENMKKIRKDFLDRIRDNVPNTTFEILKIEIPSIDSYGNVIFTGSDINTMSFPNSESSGFTGPTTIVDNDTDISRTSYFVGGNSTDNCVLEVAKINGNLAVSGSKKKEAYILSSKVTIFFRTNSSINRLSMNLLNYVNILSGNERQIITKQIDKSTIAVTIQAIGEVVLR
ncbi:hypothetical protein [Hungatella hathewayi]|uniref:hypothetical protein n=1 Tax=Hungatella hathewayi TaxID=154046 RepID=UPI00356A085B